MLDEQAVANLRKLQPGHLFKMRDNPNTWFRCDKVEHPIEQEPWIRAHEMEGPKGSRRPRMFRAIPISKVDTIAEENA